MKWKLEPQRKFDRAFAAMHGIEVADITRLVGFDADEENRMTRAIANAHKAPSKQRFPLIEWGWGREECVAAIARAGLPQPGKSACFFCPSSKVHEILQLQKESPELLAIALEIERKALAGDGQSPAFRGGGLGRTFAWATVIENDKAQGKLFNDSVTPEIDCGCYDGD
jgi:hypothetical protein